MQKKVQNDKNKRESPGEKKKEGGGGEIRKSNKALGRDNN